MVSHSKLTVVLEAANLLQLYSFHGIFLVVISPYHISIVLRCLNEFQQQNTSRINIVNSIFVVAMEFDNQTTAVQSVRRKRSIAKEGNFEKSVPSTPKFSHQNVASEHLAPYQVNLLFSLLQSVINVLHSFLFRSILLKDSERAIKRKNSYARKKNTGYNNIHYLSKRNAQMSISRRDNFLPEDYEINAIQDVLYVMGHVLHPLQDLPEGKHFFHLFASIDTPGSIGRIRIDNEKRIISNAVVYDFDEDNSMFVKRIFLSSLSATTWNVSHIGVTNWPQSAVLGPDNCFMKQYCVNTEGKIAYSNQRNILN